ncbi:hypothetical protein Q9966_016821 [Columba livia]|nr:hypothetical protein Q9966_016821 [Columba livia]
MAGLKTASGEAIDGSFELHVELDPPRLSLLYEQTRWALLGDEFDCTEEEALLFAALQGTKTTRIHPKTHP